MTLACALSPTVVAAANPIDVFPVKSGESYAPGDDVYVTARLNLRQVWFGRVSLHCKVNYGDETNTPMRANGDGTWSGECDTSGMSRRKMSHRYAMGAFAAAFVAMGAYRAVI